MISFLVGLLARFRRRKAKRIEEGGRYWPPPHDAAYRLGARMHAMFAPKGVDIDHVDAGRRGLDLAFKAQRFEAEA